MVNVKKKISVFKETFLHLNQKKLLLQNLKYDFFLVSAVTVLALIYSYVIDKLTTQLVQGQTTDQILNNLLYSDPVVAQAFLNKLRLLIVSSISGLILFLLISLLVYIFTREKIFTKAFNFKIAHLKNKKLDKKNNWQKIISYLKSTFLPWLFLIFLVLVSMFFISLLLLTLRFFLSFILTQITQDQNYASLLIEFFNIFMSVFLLIFLFACELKFIQTRKAWVSIGLAFKTLIAKKWDVLKLTTTFFLIINFIYFVFIRAIFLGVFSNTTKAFADLLVLIFFLSWIRLAYFKVIEAKTEKK